MKAEFDRFALNYDEALNEGLSATGESKEFFARGRVSCLRDRLGELGLPTRSVMDFGCGPGTTTPILRALLGADQVVGVDVSEGLLETARTHNADPSVSFMTPESWPSGETVDVVYCNGVFHHIRPDDRPRYLGLIRRTLRPGGVFALWENNPWNPGTRLVMRRIPFDRDAVLLGARGATTLLRDEGFAPLRVDYAFVFPRFARALRGLEPFLARWPLGGQYQVLARR